MNPISLTQKVSVGLLFVTVAVLAMAALSIQPAHAQEAQCSPEDIQMQVNFSNVEDRGQGRVTNTVFLGDGSQRVAEGEWFDVVRDGEMVTDESFDRDVPGLAIRRGNGWVRVHLFGNLPKEGAAADGFAKHFEVMNGSIAINGSTFTRFQNNEPGDNPVDGQGDGQHQNRRSAEDEVVFDSNSVRFFLTVTGDGDTFTLFYNVDCSTPTPTASPTPTATPTATPTPSATPTPTPTPDNEFECSDTEDNDGDTLIDAADPGCWADPLDPTSYDPRDNNEADRTTQCQDGRDNDNDGKIDSRDPGCHTDGNANNSKSYDRRDNDERDQSVRRLAACENKLDDDNDGKIDMKDPGCSTPADQDETNAVAGTVTSVPVTAKTGPGAIALVSTLLGATGLTAILRRGW